MIVVKVHHQGFLALTINQPENFEGEIRQIEDVSKILSEIKPSSLWGQNLKPVSKKGWGDVGGLTSVKDQLVQTLLWPNKVPFFCIRFKGTELFAQCPIRQSSGFLLFGLPGTGKTLLAGVIAKECSINFISIKVF